MLDENVLLCLEIQRGALPLLQGKASYPSVAVFSLPYVLDTHQWQADRKGPQEVGLPRHKPPAHSQWKSWHLSSQLQGINLKF